MGEGLACGCGRLGRGSLQKVSAVKLYEAGYTDLISVVPPGAPLSESSKIKPKQLGKVPGRKGKDGWYGFGGWQLLSRKVQLADAKRYDKWGANVGLLGTRFPGLDIDVQSKALADLIVRRAEERFGAAPVRCSRDPRRLLIFRTDEPFTRVALIITISGKSHLVEWLGDERQYLVHGQHPSGVPYHFTGTALEDTPPETLPRVNRTSAVAFLRDLAALLEPKGFVCEIVGDGASKEQKSAETVESDLLAPSMKELRALVAKIPNDIPERDGYLEMGFAVKAAGYEDEAEAFEIFYDWCGRWSAGTNEREIVEDDWSRMHAPYRVGWNWLCERAEDAGEYQTAQDDFAPDANAEPPKEKKERQIDFSDEWAVSLLLPSLRTKLRYVPGIGGSGTWHVWNVCKFTEDCAMQHEIQVRAKLTKLSVYLNDLGREIAKTCETKVERTEKAGPYFMAAKRFQSADGISSVVRLLRARLAAAPGDFDKDPMQLNTPSGVVDLTTGELRPTIEGQPFARATSVAPGGRDMPLWSQFMRDLTGGDDDLRKFIQRMCGYALSGDISEKSLWFIWGGDSDTGKSTFIRALGLLLGDYADSVDIDAFVGGRERVPADLARLPGVRLVTAAEPAAGQSWDERRIKSITGGDEISARFLYGQWFTFVPQFKILIVGNHEPEIRNVDDAMLRRIHIVPINHKVPREKQIDNLARRMVDEEGPAILSWMIEGCIQWQREGLVAPAAVLAKTSEYVDEEDTVGQWIREECERAEDAEVSREDLYHAWASWCRGRGEDPGGAKAFKHKLDGKKAKLQLEEKQVGDRRLRGYRGLRLRLRTEEGTEDFEV
jgi:P4 family phage/plasmid primase-like protien